MRLPLAEVTKQYKDRLFAAAFTLCKNKEDAEDVVQEAFLTYYLSRKEFESEEHLKAWLLRVTINKAKNVLRSFWHRNKESLEDYMDTLVFPSTEAENLFEEVLKLPENYRVVVYLFYHEDYSVGEISRILKISESNVKVRLLRGRKLLKETLKEAWQDE